MKAVTLSLALAALVAGCIPGVDIEGAPCPCPDGYSCCESLGTCLLPGSECPEAYPQSSDNPCQQDAECPRNEICQAWRLADGTLAGPGTCRHDCTNKILQCAAGEICDPVPHDARPLADMHIGWGCVDQEPISGCADKRCSDCGSPGATFCDENQEQVLGCFLSIHPVCGAVCDLVAVESCTTEGNVCEDIGGGARCREAESDGDICGAYPCDACPGGGPGTLFCQDNAVTTCAAVEVTQAMCTTGPCTCDTACVRVPVESCSGSCSEDGGAHCEP